MNKKLTILFTTLMLFNIVVTVQNKHFQEEITTLKNEMATIDIKIYEECVKFDIVKKRIEQMQYIKEVACD